MIAILFLLGVAAQPAQSQSAEDLIVEFAQRFCLEERDRLVESERFVPAGWTEYEREERRDITYGVDAPLPKHDSVSVRWRGSVPGGRMWLWARRSDYADPERADYSYARIGVSPDTLIDLDQVQRRVPLRMTVWRSFQGVAQPEIVLGDFRMAARPRRYGWLHHYRGEAVPAVPGVEITARHFTGEDYPEQMLDLSCSTAFAATN